MIIQRAYYQATASRFLSDPTELVLGILSKAHSHSLEDLQKNAWIEQINILKKVLQDFPNSYVGFEYSIPRMGKRADVVVLEKGAVFVLEFKVGETGYKKAALEQALDYAVDLKNFHSASHSRSIIPIVIATEADGQSFSLDKYDDGVYRPITANKHNLSSRIQAFKTESSIDSEAWFKAAYKPTPTIIQAAQALYREHRVEEISRSDAGAQNLSLTSSFVNQVIDDAKRNKAKAICFITGVPGSGKTLAGLNIVCNRKKISEDEHAVFLSGNGPLVQVLREALARDEVRRKSEINDTLTKTESRRKAFAFIQNIHHFRDDNLQSEVDPPIEHVVVFDEAQRAWTKEQTASFMSRKRGREDFEMSEPEFLISVMDRHQDWAVIVCIVGGGQEINTGEGGLWEWFSAIGHRFPHWNVYASENLIDDEYTGGQQLYDLISGSQLTTKKELPLAVSIRSFRSESVASFVKNVLDNRPNDAAEIASRLENYPMFLSRDLQQAKEWLRKQARGSEGLGVIASSGAYRLKPYGIHIKYSIDPAVWFLNDSSDVRAAGFLEDAATEFDIQGLELDWTCVAWDADLRRDAQEWEYKKFSGTTWGNVNKDTRKKFLLNSYRVLLTRARQGMVIYIPRGDPEDSSRLPSFYDPIYEYLVECGLRSLP